MTIVFRIVALSLLLYVAAPAFAQNTAGEDLPWLQMKKPVPQETPKLPQPDKVIEFSPDQQDFPDVKQAEIEEIAHALLENVSRHVTIHSYASGVSKEDASARQVAMKRALAVRDYLASQGISRDQIVLKVHMKAAEQAPFDRMEFILEKVEEKKN